VAAVHVLHDLGSEDDARRARRPRAVRRARRHRRVVDHVSLVPYQRPLVVAGVLLALRPVHRPPLARRPLRLARAARSLVPAAGADPGPAGARRARASPPATCMRSAMSPPRRSLLLALVASSVVTLGGADAARAFCGFYVAQADAKLFNKASQVVLVRDE